MKKILRVFLFLIILGLGVVAAFLIWRYDQYSKDPDPDKTFLMPQVKAKRVAVHSLTSDSSRIVAHLEVKNHFPFAFEIDSIHYVIRMAGQDVLKTAYPQQVVLKSSVNEFQLPMTLLTRDFKALIKEKESAGIDTVEYEISVSFYTDMLLKKKFEMSFSDSFPLYHFPKLSLDDVEIRDVSLSKALVLFHVSLHNRNVFSIKPRNISYRLFIEDHEPIEGKIPDNRELKAQSVTTYQMPLEVTMKDLRETIRDIVREKKDGKYRLELSFTLDSKGALLDNSRITLDGSSTIKKTLRKKKK